MVDGGRGLVTFGVQVQKVELQARNTFKFAIAAIPAAVGDPKIRQYDPACGDAGNQPLSFNSAGPAESKYDVCAMQRRERGGGCDGVCTRHPKSWWVLGVLGALGVENE